MGRGLFAMGTTMKLADRIAGKQVLVTGGSGFIGRHLCHRLAGCGARLHAVSRQLRQSESRHVQWWQADFRDIDAVRQVFKAVQPQIVFHLASHVVGARELGAVLPTFYDNLASTVHLLTAAAETGCPRIVLASSSEEPQIFGSTAFACSPYAAAKWASGIYGRMFHQLFQMPVVMPRIFMTYGPNQNDVQKLVPFVALHLLRGETLKLTSGQRLADWIYVDDVVEGLLRAAIIPGIEGCTFDLGSGSLVSVREVVELIVEITGTSIRPAFGAIPDRPFEQERSADTTFLSNELGCQPRTSLKHGLETTVAWYRQQLNSALDEPRRHVPDSWADFHDGQNDCELKQT
jgi:UDP-glucose 4-epimerase